MNSKSDYANDAMTALFAETGVIFAFDKETFDKKKTKNTEYVRVGVGYIVPTSQAKYFVDSLAAISERSREIDVKENGIIGIIQRELVSFECEYTREIEEISEYLNSYGITKKQIQDVACFTFIDYQE